MTIIIVKDVPNQSQSPLTSQKTSIRTRENDAPLLFSLLLFAGDSKTSHLFFFVFGCLPLIYLASCGAAPSMAGA